MIAVSDPPFTPTHEATLASVPARSNGRKSVVICDPDIALKFKMERESKGLGKYDEAWDGDTIVMSLPNDEHQDIVTRLAGLLLAIYSWQSPPHIRAGVNVSDRVEGWKENYHCPDVTAYLEGNPAKNCGTHWCGGPDFLVEILSPDDPGREKLPFYASVNSREVLVIDRKPWQLELYTLRDGKLLLAGISTLDQTAGLKSTVLPLTFRLVAGAARPMIEIVHATSGQVWVV